MKIKILDFITKLILIIILLITISKIIEFRVFFNEFNNNYMVELKLLNIKQYYDIDDILILNEDEDFHEFNVRR